MGLKNANLPPFKSKVNQKFMNRRHVKGPINQGVLSENQKYRHKNIDIFASNLNKINQKVLYQEPSENSQER